MRGDARGGDAEKTCRAGNGIGWWVLAATPGDREGGTVQLTSLAEHLEAGPLENGVHKHRNGVRLDMVTPLDESAWGVGKGRSGDRWGHDQAQRFSRAPLGDGSWNKRMPGSRLIADAHAMVRDLSQQRSALSLAMSTRMVARLARGHP